MTILRTAYDETIHPAGYTLACIEFVMRGDTVEREMVWMAENGPAITEDDLPF